MHIGTTDLPFTSGRNQRRKRRILFLVGYDTQNMIPVIAATAVAILILLLAVLADDLTIAPGPKRTHIFESEQGEKENPFGDLANGAEDSATRCRGCGNRVEDETYRHCGSCVGAKPTDD